MIAALRAQLPEPIRDRLGALDWQHQVDSSNSVLLRAADTLPDRAALVVDMQSAGRGRRGRTWQSPPDANLYLSLFARIDRPLAALAGLSLAAGIALVDALRDAGVGEVGLKWPNDLLARDRKLGGLLVESAGERDGRSAIVLGLGLNVAMPVAAAAAIEQPWIDLATLGQPTDRVCWAALVIAALMPMLDRFERDGLSGFAARWPAVDVWAGRELLVLGADGEHAGRADGIAADGALRLRTASGERHFHSAEVSLRTP